MHYHPEVTGVFTDIAIHYWDAADEAWEELGGLGDLVDNALAVTTTRLGVYALMGEQITNEVYLPIIVK